MAPAVTLPVILIFLALLSGWIPTQTQLGCTVEWFAGACVLHYRENLVMENFWSLPGKAYYEDVVHSPILAVNGIRLVIDPSARCSLELFHQASLKPGDFFRNLYRDYLGRRYYMRRFSRQSFRIYLYYFGRVLSYLVSRLK